MKTGGKSVGKNKKAEKRAQKTRGEQSQTRTVPSIFAPYLFIDFCSDGVDC